jgi:hypothetical protein
VVQSLVEVEVHHHIAAFVAACESAREAWELAFVVHSLDLGDNTGHFHFLQNVQSPVWDPAGGDPVPYPVAPNSEMEVLGRAPVLEVGPAAFSGGHLGDHLVPDSLEPSPHPSTQRAAWVSPSAPGKLERDYLEEELPEKQVTSARVLDLDIC